MEKSYITNDQINLIISNYKNQFKQNNSNTQNRRTDEYRKGLIASGIIKETPEDLAINTYLERFN